MSCVVSVGLITWNCWNTHAHVTWHAPVENTWLGVSMH